MTATWIASSNGNWDNAALWSTNPFIPDNNTPAGTTYAVVAPAGFYTLTVNTNATVDSISMLGGVLRVDQRILSLAGNGPINLGPNARFNMFFGTLRDAVLNLGTTTSGLRLEGSSNTFNNVTINGSSTLTDNTVVMGITNGLTLNGTLRFQNRVGGIEFTGTQTISGGTFFFDLAPINPETRLIVMNEGSTVTLDPNVVVRGRDLRINAPMSNGVLVNHGRISSETAGTLVTVRDRVNNTGTIEAVNGGIMNLEGNGWTTSGTLRAGAGSTLNLLGNGTISASTLDTAAGTVNISGIITNTGTLALNSSSGSWNLVQSGVLSGGAFTTTDGAALNVTSSGPNRLLGVTFDGLLNVAPAAFVRIDGGSFAGTATVGAGGTLDFTNNWSSNALINVNAGTVNLNGAFTLGAGFDMERTGGTVNVPGDFTNTGSILTLDAGTGSWNLNGGTITGGTLRLLDDANLSPNASSGNRFTGVTLDGTLSLTNSGARLRSVNGLSGGTVRLTGPDAAIVFDNSQTLASDIQFAGTVGANARLAIDQASVLTIAPGTHVHGGRATIGGHLFNQGPGSIINQGTISADVPGQTLTINASASGSSLNNQGLLRAVGGGAMVLNGLSGNTGNIAVDGAGSSFGIGGTYTINNPINVTNGGLLNLTGTWTNAAGINLTDSTLSLGGNFTTNSVGTVNRTNSVIRVTGNWNNAGSTIMLNAGGPIVLAGGSITGGTIDGSAGGTLTTTPSSTSTLTNTILNGNLDLTGATLNTTALQFAGVANITAGATMNLNGAWNNNGTINVNAATLNLGGTVTNVGTINRSGNAVVGLSGILNAPTQTVTISPTSLFTAINQGQMSVSTLALFDNPTLPMNGGAVHASAYTGDGVISLSNGAALTPPGSGPGGMMTIGEGVTVRGGNGSIGHAPTETSTDVAVNNGVITADASGPGINIWARNFTNAGFIEVSNNANLFLYHSPLLNRYTEWTNTGTMRVNSGVLFLGGRFQTADIGNVEHLGGEVQIYGDLDNTGATLNLDTRWTIGGNDATIRNGVVNVDPSTHLLMLAHGTLQNVTFNGDIVSDFGEIAGGLTLNGTATIPNHLRLIGNQTITAGNFHLAGGTMDAYDGTAFTFGPDVLVHGRGLLAAGTAQSLVNDGRISADVPDQRLTLNQSTLINFGTIEAVNAGHLELNALNVFNEGIIRVASGGRLDLGGSSIHLGSGTLVDDGGTLTITGTVDNVGSTMTIGGAGGNLRLGGRINGGTVNSTGGARLLVVSGRGITPTLDAVTLNADVDTSYELEILNNLSLTGTVNLGADVRFLGASNTLTGGALALAHPVLSEIQLASGGTLNIAPGTTIRGGRGVIADDAGVGAPGVQNFVVNSGTISADVSGTTLSIVPDVFTNHGILEALEGATLNIASQIPGVGASTRTWTNDGTIRVDGGTLLLGGTFQSSSVADIRRTGDGEVRLVGTMDNTNATLTLDGPEESWVLEAAGAAFGQFSGTQIVGGTVNLHNGARFDSFPDVAFGGGGGLALTDAIVNGDMRIDGNLFLYNSTVNGTVTVAGSRVVVAPPFSPPPGEQPAPETLSSGNFVFVDEGPRFGSITGNFLTIGPMASIRGGHGEVVAIANQGLISADLPADSLVARIGLNTGVIEAVNGGTLVLAPAGDGLVNNGTIRVIDSTLVFTGSTPVFNSIERTNATVAFEGLVDNSDALLELDPDTSWYFNNSLYLKGGTVDIQTELALPLGNSDASLGPVTLDGVTISGDMETLPNCQRIVIRRGLTLDGMLRVSTPESITTFVGDQEFAGGTIFFDPAGGDGERLLRLHGLGFNGAGSATLTINSDAVIRGGDARISTGLRTAAEATVVNNGLISADISGERITIEAPRFINNGTVQAINGGQIIYEGPPPLGPGDPLVFENNGILSVGAGSIFEADVLRLADSGTIQLMIAGVETHDDFGRVSANELFFDGALSIEVSDTYVPSYGDTFDLFDFSARHGVFSALSLPDLPGDFTWHTDALSTTGALTVIPTPASLALLAMGTLIVIRRKRS